MGRWAWVLGWSAVAILSLWAVPPERVLGAAVRLVYLHGALTWAGLIFYAVAGLMGLLRLLTGRPWYGARAHGAGWRGGLAWLLSLAASVPAAVVSWHTGGLKEPRFWLVAGVLALSAAAVAWRGMEGGGAALPAALWTAAALAAWAGSFFQRRLLHPHNPILASHDPRYIVAFFVLTASLVALGLTLPAGGGRELPS